MAGKLFVTDGRNGRKHEVSINHNTVQASDLAKIQYSADDQTPNPLRIVDESLKHIAIGSSRITFLDAEKGRLYYRGHDISTIVGKKSFEETCYCLIWGELPSSAQATLFRELLVTSTEPTPQAVFDVVQRLP